MNYRQTTPVSQKLSSGTDIWTGMYEFVLLMVVHSLSELYLWHNVSMFRII
jgi:hypothetical protein